MKRKRIIVTGSSRGIGKETVRALLELGHEVLAISRNCGLLGDLKGRHQYLSALELDFTEEAGLEEILAFVGDQWSSVDGLVHNAGVLLNKSFEETTVQDMMSVYRVNVFSVAELTRRLLPFFSRGAHVVGISSMGGIQGSMKFPGLAAYSSSKGALITLMELLAEEFKEKGLFFNTLALGAVQTEMLAEAFPGYQALVTAEKMGAYVAGFVLTGHELFNGKVLQVSNSTP
jgi:NAD(P)-dependent dehydrogenase (short-subunit alcohol dehydrogenase family)